MNQINQPKAMIQNNNRLNRLFYRWFVLYNPLYFISALCFVFGVYLVSTGMNQINWIDGQIILTAVIEFYEILLLAGSLLLYRIASLRRPAVILAIINICFLFDCTYQIEHISSVPYFGQISTLIWISLFALKLIALTWIFRLDVPLAGYLIPILAGVGIAVPPHFLYYTTIDSSLIHLVSTWYGAVLTVIFLWFRPVVGCPEARDPQRRTILNRVFNAAWLIWSGFYLFHTISWIRFFDIDVSLANLAPVFVVLPFVSKKEEFTWIGSALVMLLSLAHPPIFCVAAFFIGMVFLLNGMKNRQPRLYIGAILSIYLALATVGWQNFPLPKPDLSLTVLTGMGLVSIGWYFRLISAFLIAILGGLAYWNPRGPHDIMEWGALFIAVGFISLGAGILANWKFRFMSSNMEENSVCGR